MRWAERKMNFLQSINTTNSINTLSGNALTLNQRLAAIFGGGSTPDANNIVTAPSYSIQGKFYNSVGGAFGAVDAKLTSTDSAIINLSTQINSGSVGLMTQDSVTRQIAVGKLTDGTAVDFTGTAGARKLTGIQVGTLSASSSDAVSGSQLFATDSSVSANTTSITTLTTNTTTLNQRLACRSFLFPMRRRSWRRNSIGNKHFAWCWSANSRAL
jgi:hypothetical protein